MYMSDSVMIGETAGQRGQVWQRQEPMLYGSFVGTLGTNSLPAELLAEVRQRPQDYKALLLTIIFDPLPSYSSRWALSDVFKRLSLHTVDVVDGVKCADSLRNTKRKEARHVCHN